MSTIESHSNLDYCQQMANFDAKRKLAEFEAQWEQVANNPYTNKGAPIPWKGSTPMPMVHDDWTYEWTEVSRDKVISLLRSGVAVKAVATDEEPALTSEMLTVNAPRGRSLDGLSDFTVGIILDTRWKNCRFVVRTE